MGLPNNLLEHTRPETIATLVNKPWESPIPSSLRYGHPEAHRAVGRDIIYTIIIYYILLYIELRESQTATITFSSMPQSPRTALHWVWRLNADWLLRYTCHSVVTLLKADWLSSREICVKVEIFQLERICCATNPRERARLCTAKVWHDKLRLVWTHNALLPRRRHV